MKETNKGLLLKYEITISEIEYSTSLRKSFDKYLGKYIEKEKDWFERICDFIIQRKIQNYKRSLRKEIKRIKKLDPNATADKFFVQQYLLNGLNKHDSEMSEFETEYIKMLEANSEIISNTTLYVYNDFYEHRVAPAKFENFDGCRKFNFSKAKIVTIENNDDCDCLIIDY